MSEGISSPGDRPVLIVYSFDSDYRRYSFSSFVTKLHLRLRYAGVSYENARGSRSQAPKDKIPYVRFLETGELMGDSALIAQKLVETGKIEDVAEKLSPELRAMDYCIRCTIEDRLYYLLVGQPFHVETSLDSLLTSGSQANSVRSMSGGMRTTGVCATQGRSAFSPVAYDTLLPSLSSNT